MPDATGTYLFGTATELISSTIKKLFIMNFDGFSTPTMFFG